MAERPPRRSDLEAHPEEPPLQAAQSEAMPAEPQYEAAEVTPSRGSEGRTGAGSRQEQAPRGGPADAAVTAAPPRKKAGVGKWVAAAAVAVVAVTAYLAMRGPVPNTEENQPNYQYVKKANEANDMKFKTSKDAEVSVERVSNGQLVGAVGLIGVTAADLDTGTTDAVRQALQGGNPQQIQAALKQAVQKVPPLPANLKDDKGQPLAQPDPVLTPPLVQAVSSGDAQFVRVFIFDSCAEDGDIVEVLVDGQPFAIVPLTIAGTTVSVPVSTAAPTHIALRGVVDGGGGGVTVGARTSMGDFFARAMYVGETEELGIARQ